MKSSFNIGWVFIAAICFSACSGGNITQTYTDNQGKYLPINDSLLQLEQAGYVTIDRNVAGNPLIQDVMVKFEPSFLQKVSIAKKDKTGTIAVILVLLSLGLIVWGIIYGSNAGKWVGAPVAAFVFGILLDAGAFATINWAHTKEIGVAKRIYDNADSLRVYIDQNLYK